MMCGSLFGDRRETWRPDTFHPLRREPNASHGPVRATMDTVAEDPRMDDLFDFEWPSQRTSQRHSQLRDHVSSEEGSRPPSTLPEPAVRRTRANTTVQASSQRPASPEGELTFLEEKEWVSHKSYSEDPKQFHYLVEWSLRLNGKSIAKESIPGVVISLGSYWWLVLQTRLEEVVASTSS